jgi:glyceraldehyde-3-phosphate dehydrogenase (NADP+)
MTTVIYGGFFMHSFLKNTSFIGNQWVQGNSNDILQVKNKYNHSLLAEISYLNADQLDSAFDISQVAYEQMKNWDAGKRSELLEKLQVALIGQKESFAQLISAEAGKPIEYANAEIERCITTLQMSAEEARRISGEVVPMDFGIGVGKNAFTQRFPVGIIGCISPFNFPLNLALHKIGPALALGNSVILKPSPYTPLTALAFAALVQKVGYPAGAINVVICENDVAEKILTEDRVKVFSFTGSPQVGWELKNKAKKKKVILELGGNAAVIVDHSADLELACEKVVPGAFLYSGQICISTQRVYVDSGVYDEFIERLLERTEEVESGNPANKKVINGPIIDEVHINRIHEWVQEAVAGGARVLTGGHILDEEHNIYAPTILTDTTPDMKVVSEEIFGPVLIVERTDYFDDAVELVNDSKFGLQAGLFTNQISQMKYAFSKLEVGALLINNIPGFRIDNMPYGGVKDSGLGREGIKYTIEEMSEPKLMIF